MCGGHHDWMAETVLAIMAVIPVRTLANKIHAFRQKNGTSTEARKRTTLSEIGMETPGEDAAEQAREVPEEDDAELHELPFEVDEADAAEQVRDVGYDDEDYR